MKNQKKNKDEKTNSTKDEVWLTPEEAAKKLGLSYSVEKTHAFKAKIFNKISSN
jgi:hypothetical protein